ncbi:hypothetical protein L9F63_019127, partial [Diploptera punctata]
APNPVPRSVGPRHHTLVQSYSPCHVVRREGSINSNVVINVSLTSSYKTTLAQLPHSSHSLSDLKHNSIEFFAASYL